LIGEFGFYAKQCKELKKKPIAKIERIAKPKRVLKRQNYLKRT